MDDLTREELEQLHEVFRDQTQEILDEMSQDILALESSGDDADVMVRLRRGSHTIKGDSACVGLDGIAEVAHRLEDVFDAIVNAKAGLDREVADLMLESLDAVRESVCGESVEDIPRPILNVLLERLSEVGFQSGGELDIKKPMGNESVAKIENISKAFESSKGKRDFVRVEAARIDTLLDLAGEMVIAQSFMNQLSEDLAQTIPSQDMAKSYVGAVMRMGRLVGEMQKSVLKMRMVPINNVFKRYVRPMRDLAAERGKAVELEISGGETELDRALIDLLYEPLLHLLRNAVDHGIEASEEREAVGKHRVGKLSLMAYYEGNQVVIEVSDDGRGVDRELLKSIAIEKGVISSTEADEIGDEGTLELIYLSGLSTAKGVSLVSGRGIGASAVKAAIEQLRGGITVKSEKGKGTTFTIRMPLTLAIIRALLFMASGRLFALSLLSVSEVVRVKAEEVVYLNGVENYRLRDRFISLITPGDVLGFDRRRGGKGISLRGGDRDFFIIVLGLGSKRYGIVADALVGDQELVIKPLDNEWTKSEVLVGASVLGDGRVALIMDAGMMFLKAVRYERGKESRRGNYVVGA